MACVITWFAKYQSKLLEWKYLFLFVYINIVMFTFIYSLKIDEMTEFNLSSKLHYNFLLVTNFEQFFLSDYLN